MSKVEQRKPTRIPSDGTIGPSSEWGLINGKGFFVVVAPAKALVHEDKRFTPDETLVGQIDFVPPGNTASRILSGIHGLRGFFRRVEEGMPEPEYLFGNTNKEMANASRRLGFEVTHVPNDNRYGLEYYRVVGKTTEVRKKFEELLNRTDKKGRTIVELLNKRANS